MKKILLILASKVILWTSPVLWNVPFEWAFKLHQRLGNLVTKWHHNNKLNILK